MRVLPRVHEEINEEWLSDKGRHAFDGLKKQRLTVPLKRDQEGNLKEMLWEDMIPELASHINKY
jgi:NADH dehydrogenase/NADH:ubiquinone oxidoreductase subunit G